MSFFGNRRAEPPPAREEKTEPPRPALAPPQQPIGFETVLGANSTLEGVFRSAGNVRLDGTFTGTLEINGNVLVGETAKITADINAKNISVAGAVRGNIIGKKVQLLRTGRVWGDIQATALTTEEGAFIDGKIKMVGNTTDSLHSSDTLPAMTPPMPINPEATKPLPVISADTAPPAERDATHPTVPDDDTDPERRGDERD